MNKLLTYVLAAMAFVACTQNEVEELTANRQGLPETLTVGFEGSDTRVELNEVLKTVWTEGDEVSVFYQSYDNMRWAFQGATGDRSGELKLVSGEITEQTMDNIIVAYPYDANYRIDIEDKALHASLPAVQSYKEGSYGAEGNIMVAESKFTKFTLKSVVGWLRVELTGNAQQVESVKVRGNNGEQLAGLCYIDAADASVTLASNKATNDEDGDVSGNLNFDGSMLTEVVLNCGDGVELGAEATEFYVALLPQTFDKGMTVEINYANGNSQTLVCENVITIERNHIQPIDCGEFNGRDPLSNEIIYATNDGNKIELYHPESFDANVIEESYDVATGMGKIVFDKPITTIPKNTFGLCETITVLVIPEGVEVIEENAFTRCTSLKEIVIPSTVKSFGDAAFYECTGCLKIDCDIPDATATKGCFTGSKFTEIVFEDFASRIGTYAFYNLDTIEKISFGNGTFRICSNAFEGCDNLKEVVFGENIEVIDYRSFFNCDSLTDIVILDSTLALGKEAFAGCDNLANVTIGSGIVETGSSVFANCKARLTVNFNIPDSSDIFDNSQFSEVTFGDGVTYIGANSFYNLDSITKVTFGNGDFAIGTKAFHDCSAITDVTFGNGDFAIGTEAFYDCSAITDVTFGNGDFAIGTKAFYDCSAITDVTFGSGNSTVGESAFHGCIKLTNVDFGSGNSTIGKSAFHGCIKLTNVDLGNVSSIDREAFGSCGLKKIVLPESVSHIGYAAFRSCSDLVWVECLSKTPSEVSLVDGKWEAFDGNAKDRKIFIPDGAIRSYSLEDGWEEYIDYLTVVNDNLFRLRYTTNDNQPINLSVIDGFGAAYYDATFDEATGEGAILFDASPTTIPDNAFKEMTNLTSIIIPDSVISIGAYVFNGCSSMQNITIGSGVTAIGTNAFYGCAGKAIINCNIPGRTSGNDYHDVFYGAIFTEVIIGDNVTTIGEGAFKYCDSLTSVTIPDSVTTIGNEAFYDCDSLTSVTIGESVTTIGSGAFYDCDSLTSVTIPDSVTTIGYRAFISCSNLTGVTIGDSITTIGGYAFSNCTSLTSVTIPDSVTTIGNGAFDSCTSLTSVTIGNSVTTIGDYAFRDCSSLTSVTIGNSVTTIGNGAFEDCDSLTSVYITDIAAWCNISFGDQPLRYGADLYLNNELVTDLTIPDSVTTIGRYAFQYCDSLISVTIPDSVTTIGEYAFYKCSRLTSVTIGDSVTTIGERAFYDCDSLTSVTIGDSVTTIGDRAFYDCTSLTSVYCEATIPPSLGDAAFKYLYDYGNFSVAVNIGCPIYVPAESVEAYKAATNWSGYKSDIFGYNFETGEVVE